MSLNFKRLVSGIAATAVVSGTFAALVAVPMAEASHLSGGTNDIVTPLGAPLASGGSATPFQFKLPIGSAAFCTGDSTNSGYRIQSYLVPLSVDLDTLRFDSSGPVPVAGQFRDSMYETSGSAFVNRTTANQTVANGPGQITQPLPDFSFGIYDPGAGFPLPPGAYNIGIACTLGASSPTQLDKYFNTVVTISTNLADSPGQINWNFGAVPAAPVITGVTPNNGALAVAFTSTASTPATTSFTATATPASGPAITATGATSPITVGGLANGTAYSVTITATNTTGTSAASTAFGPSASTTPGQPLSPAVQNVVATPGTGKVDLTWTAPADAGTRPPTGYTVTNLPAGGTTVVSGTTASVTGLTAGTSYTFEITATYAAAPGGTPLSISSTPLAAQVLLQTLTVTRPAGALVFTQVCGRKGDVAAEILSNGFPDGLPAVVATAPGAGTAPTGAGGLEFSEYPYPEDSDGVSTALYPTTCGVTLGNAKLVTRGTGAGKFFSASAVLDQVSVVDVRDIDAGWTANGKMSSFDAGPGKSFSGSQLGWVPIRTSDTDAFQDSAGTWYNQVAPAGPEVLPNTLNASGMSSNGRVLGSAAALGGGDGSTEAAAITGGTGLAVFDARLKLLIPVTAKSGTYTGTLTISAA